MQVSVQPGHRTSIGNMEDMMLHVVGPSTTTSSAGNVYNSADLYIIYVMYGGTGAEEILWQHTSRLQDHPQILKYIAAKWWRHTAKEGEDYNAMKLSSLN